MAISGVGAGARLEQASLWVNYICSTVGRNLLILSPEGDILTLLKSMEMLPLISARSEFHPWSLLALLENGYTKMHSLRVRL